MEREMAPPRAVTALELLQSPGHTRRHSLGCSVLDEALGGGIPGHGIIEFAGMAGSGKTQLMMQIIITHQYNLFKERKTSRCFYLSTEGAFPAHRLQNMALARFPRDTAFVQHLMDSVITADAKNVEEQLYMLTHKLPELLQEQGSAVRLCIVDSISGLFRSEYGREDAIEKAQITFAMAKIMKKLSYEYEMPFVVTNQVTADLRVTADAEHALQPAMGLSWSVCVHTRFLIVRRDIGQAGWKHPVGGQPPSAFVREIKLILSPIQPPARTCQFVVEASGVRGLHKPGSPSLGAAQPAATSRGTTAPGATAVGVEDGGGTQANAANRRARDLNQR